MSRISTNDSGCFQRPRRAVSPFDYSEQTRSGTKPCEFVTRVTEWAVLHGKAATPDAETQLVVQFGGECDFCHERSLPCSTHLLPIRFGRHTILWKVPECLLNLIQRKPQALGHFDKGQNAKLAPGETPLIPPIPNAANQLFGLVEVDSRDSYAASPGYFTNCQQLVSIIFRSHETQLGLN